MTDLLKFALRYAKAGFPVLPCKGKRPLLPDGFKGASTVPDVVRAWFDAEGEKPSVAIAIPPFAVVLDVDGEEGRKNLEEHGYTPPATATVKTPRGWHYWYIWRGEQSPIRKIGFLPRVDILSNGYVMAPPSHGYAWEDGDGLTKDTIEMAPEWLTLTLAESQAMRESIDVDDWFSGLPRGSHQTGLFRYACRLRGIPRMTKTEARVLVTELTNRCKDAGKWDGGAVAYAAALVDRVWKTYDAVDDTKRVEESERVWSLSDLLSEVHDPPNYLVDRLLPGLGYTILFAAQGVGKSVLADQVAVAISTGQPIFGRRTRQSGVLVLDVEQDPAGAADRWRKMLKGMFLSNPPANLYTAFSWPSLDDGGFQKIADFVVEHPHVQLVVVDTLAQATGMDEGGGNAYFTDNKAMSKFTRFANEYGIAFLVCHHSRKATAGGKDNFSDMASGTRGITGPAKARWGLTYDEESNRGTLQVGGKLPPSITNLTFDREHLLWR